jgi:hypothetical protein
LIRLGYYSKQSLDNTGTIGKHRETHRSLCLIYVSMFLCGKKTSHVVAIEKVKLFATLMRNDNNV